MFATNAPRRCSLLPFFLCCAVVGAAERWQNLLAKDPFAGEAPAKPAVAAPPLQYEFRGRSVENGVEYFSLYNLETKKAFWVSKEGKGEMRVENFDPATGLVLADAAGQLIHLAMKEARPTSSGGTRLRAVASLASAARSMPAPAPAQAAPLNESESKRLEQVADQVRARRAERKKATEASI